MADLSLLGDTFDGDLGEFEDEGEEGGMGLDSQTSDDLLSPLQKLQKYVDNDNTFNRQMVARNLLDTIRSVCDNPEERDAGLECMARLSDDIEPLVRAEVMEQIPHIAMLCQENKMFFPDTIQEYILPTVVRYLTDNHNQVRKTSQAALLVLLEQDLIERADMEEHVCPVIIQLSCEDSSDDYRTEAVALMSKVAPLVGKEITWRLFLPQFTELCSDSLFHIRKVCAANFGDICNVVGEEATEEMLLPKFEALCEDSVWGVRKACAECFMAVSWAVTRDVRKIRLSPLFVKLLCDQSRWVRMAAFQALGPFISTFADPAISGIQVIYNADGTVQIASVEDMEVDESARTSAEVHLSQDVPANEEDVIMESGVTRLKREFEEKEYEAVGKLEVSLGKEEESEFNSFVFWRNPVPVIAVDGSSSEGSDSEGEQRPSDAAANESNTQLSLPTGPGGGTQQEGTLPDSGISSPVADSADAKPEEASQNTDSNQVNGGGGDATAVEQNLNEDIKDLVTTISSINLDEKQEGVTPPEKPERSELANDDAASENGNGKVLKAAVNEANDLTETAPQIGSTQVIGQRLDEKTLTFVNGIVEEEWSGNGANRPPQEEDSDEDEQSLFQDVIPVELLDLYLSMTDPSRATTVDSEIACHCAFSLPGVALTLGRHNWKCLKLVYDTLASDMQWKVRRTLAFSIHEMALILGDEITTLDLVPIFNGFLRDLDEVRIGVLKHFADFTKLLKPELRRQYLTRMTDFLTTDNQRNWRFRLELAEQLVLLCDLFDPSDVCEHLFPIALTLAGDRVADVRFTAYKLLGVIFKKVNVTNNATLQRGFVNDIITKFAHSPRWFGRQTYVHLCQKLLDEQSMDPEMFAQHFLPSLLELTDDSIPNVKITLSKTLTQYVLPIEYFRCRDNAYHEQLMQALQQLQNDEDRDVRYFASLSPYAAGYTELGFFGQYPWTMMGLLGVQISDFQLLEPPV
ncbi:serine/threonine-protein phosphatase 4 regulatory subunit 1-like isoform X2 [Amphiura filiformis]|uniref:serine/threonine-protein phosphatase 4 regulatory subunit 1-like isoform X2 n=1 Tax=Amphiura filiformis TaxID=82378 RepID=UPI003B21AE9D